MKWTLMVTTCLLAFAFSPSASARHSHKQTHETHRLISGTRAAMRRRAENAGMARRANTSRLTVAARAATVLPQSGTDTKRGSTVAASPSLRSGTIMHRRVPDMGDLSQPGTGACARARGAGGGSVGLASYCSARGLTAAHRSLPFGMRVRVTNMSNGSSVIVRIADRGPFIRGRAIDLSASAARALRMTGAGVARVRMHVI